MAIPKYDEIQYEALKLMNDGITRKARDFIDPLALVFQLSDSDLSKEYESGNGFVFADRITWALSYLNMAGLVSKPKRGMYKINEQGLELLARPEKFKKYVSKKYKERVASIQTQVVDSELTQERVSSLTPEESLHESYQSMKDTIFQDILEMILLKTPREFERLVVLLLQKMGYGGEVKDSGIVTQYSRDKGIDGIIKEDVLGFGSVYIQAKRYSFQNKVSSKEVRDFAGALLGTQSQKGVFITTSDFARDAYQFVQDLTSNYHIVLINGAKLAEYIFEYNIGLQTERIIEVKSLDGDFWDKMQDDTSIASG